MPVNFGVRNCLEPPELWHADVVPVKDANCAPVSLSVAIIRSTKYRYNLQQKGVGLTTSLK